MKLARMLALAEHTPPAVVLQVSYANGLGVIRDLAVAGVPVLGLDASPAALGFSSRYAAGMLCPDPVADEEAFLVFLEEVGAHLPQRGVLFPTHDQYIWPLSRHAERLEKYFHVPFSRWDAMQRVYDKRTQMEAAVRCGADIPRTAYIDSAADLTEAAAAVTYPAVLKPADSLAFKQRFGRQVVTVASPAELHRVYPKVDDLGTLLLQERISGGDDQLYTLGSYVDAGGRPLAVWTGHKLRQHPAGAGSCRLGVSLWDPALAETGLRILKELGYHGVSQVEFKRDPRTGRDSFMEVNARHWMWHALAAASGVNLSLAAYRDAIGKPYLAARQTDGAKWVVATKDTPLSMREIWRGEQTPLGWLRSVRGVRVDGVLSLKDPVPGIRNLKRVTVQIATRRPSKRIEV